MVSTLIDGARLMAGKKKWMKKAFANSHGQFRAKAEHAGESTKEFANEKEHAPGLVGKQARLAEAGMAAHKHKTHASLSKSLYRRKG